MSIRFEVRPEGGHGAYLHWNKSAMRIVAAVIGELAKVEDGVPKLDWEVMEYMKRSVGRDAVDGSLGEGAADIMFKATLNLC